MTLPVVEMYTSGGLAVRRSAGPGARVLWIHGYTLDGSIWTESWEALPSWHHVAVDLPGHGASRALGPGETLRAWALTLRTIVHHEQIEHVVALSFGTLVALELASLDGLALQTVTLAAPTFLGGPTDVAAQARNLELRRHWGAHGRGPSLTDLWMSSPPAIFDGARQRPELIARLRSVILCHRWDELENGAMRYLTEGSHSAALRRVRARTLLLVGDDDMVAFRRAAELLRRSVAGAVRAHVRGGHLCLLEHPRESAERIRVHIEGR